MRWKPQPDTGVPVFKQIVRYFEEQILKGDLPPGARLPAERELAGQLHVNRSTVSTAYEELRAGGFVTSVKGSGTRVCELQWEEKPVPVPNWRRYTGGRTFDPTASVYRRQQEAALLPGIVNLTKGELSPDLMPLELLRELAEEADYGRAFSYHDDFRGGAELRGTLADLTLAGHGISASPEHLVITAGVKHSLHLIAHTLLEPGDAIAVEGPSYLYAMGVFSAAGLRMVRLPMDREGLIPEALPELYYKHRIRMVFTNPSYQNPTGTCLSAARRKKLLEVCESLRLPIVEDDPYSDLYLDQATPPPPSLKALSGGDRFVIYLGTLSKTATPGMRLGWIAAPLPAASRLAQAKNRMGYSTSHAGERLGGAYLRSPAAKVHLATVRRTLALRRSCMLQALREHAGGIALPLASDAQAGGFYLWLQLARPVPDRELVEAGIREGVLFYPGSLFGAEPGFFQLTYASVGEAEILLGARRIGQALAGLGLG
ncbi:MULTISPECIES: aminotransferase-like domain-containing protein [Paenibacillus]|uniref:aminotransferase-like domain-containing protein n=1 Tax=Paenibacillus TaxID=44249 RepID=UPI0022B8AD4C|nr:PLP-dependent aminotransferase family protein [Paenibacillus caseinilyticus]MCZ8520692.1 PLP-dependent aminotransferase family protein [Paenibacillus caseinilyticus]